MYGVLQLCSGRENRSEYKEQGKKEFVGHVSGLSEFAKIQNNIEVDRERLVSVIKWGPHRNKREVH